MSEEVSGKLSTLTAMLKAAEVEKTEAYIQSDWHRVWQLTNIEIPNLEREIAALSGTETATPDDDPNKSSTPLDFVGLTIELIESKNSLFNIYIRRQPFLRKYAKVNLVFSRQQLEVVEKYLLSHVVFYEAEGEVQVTVADLMKGPWTSRSMRERDANGTAENAREGINDLRLIIQARARHDHR